MLSDEDELRTSDEDELRTLATALLRAVGDIQRYLAGPVAPDAEVQAWPLYAAEDSGGGIWCADEDCPLQAENSEIGYFREGTFTIVELHQAISHHISARRDRLEEAEENGAE